MRTTYWVKTKLTNFRRCLKRRKFFVAAALLSIMFTLFLGWFSQFLFMNEYMKRGYATLAAPLVGNRYHQDSINSLTRSAAPSITILKVTDADLEDGKISYPPSYAYHAKRLNALGEIGTPKILFIDLLFLDERDDFKKLENALCKLREAGTKIYIASIQPERSLSSDFNKKTQLSNPNLVWPSGKNTCDLLAAEVSVWKKTDTFSHLATSYSLISSPTPPATGLNSAAYQIYLDLVHSPLAIASTDPIALVWGTESTSKANNCRNELTWSDNLALPNSLARYIDTLATKPFCPYFKEFTIGEFHRQETLETQETLIDGQIVFYGFQLAGINDYSHIPTSLAQVHSMNIHAMALDNLLVYGADVKTDKNALSSNNLFNIESKGLLWFNIAIFMAIILLSELIPQISKFRPLARFLSRKFPNRLNFPLPNTRSISLKIIMIILSPLLIWPVMAIGHGVLNLGVLSWIELAAIFLFTELIDLRESIEKDLKSIFHNKKDLL